MKKLSKTILSIAAVSAVSAVMAASAMAMTASYDAGSVTLAGVEATGDSQTLLVLSEDADTVTEAIIKQIDQKDDGSSFATVTVGDLAVGTYYVRVGGSNGTLQKAEFTIGEQGGEVDPPAGETESIIVGDVNLNGSITSADTSFLARQQAKFTVNIGKVGEHRTAADGTDVIIGDVNLNGSITSADTSFLARQQAKFTVNIGKVGETVNVIKVAE